MTRINTNFLEGFSNDEIERAKIAINMLEETINSEVFKEKVLAVPKFTKNKIKRKTGNKRYNNQEILDLILSGEDLNNPADGVINLNLKLYDSEKNEIGHTNMTTLQISTYRGYFSEKDIENYAAHLLHEYMHVIGFVHGHYDIFGKRHKTVPYRIGKLTLKILKPELT